MKIQLPATPFKFFRVATLVLAALYGFQFTANAAIAPYLPSPQPTATLTPASGYSLYRYPGSSITMPISTPTTGYAFAAVLIGPDGSVVRDQSDFTYEWSASNTKVISIAPFNSTVPCAYGIQAPCPYDHVLVKGLATGSATITAKVKRVSTGTTETFTTFSVTVVPATPTPSPTVMPSISPSPTATASASPTPSPTATASASPSPTATATARPRPIETIGPIQTIGPFPVETY